MGLAWAGSSPAVAGWVVSTVNKQSATLHNPKQHWTEVLSASSYIHAKEFSFQSFKLAEPYSLSHTVLASEWVLCKQFHPSSTQADEGLESAKDWYPEWCLCHLMVGKRWPNGRCGASCPRGRALESKANGHHAGRGNQSRPKGVERQGGGIRRRIGFFY